MQLQFSNVRGVGVRLFLGGFGSLLLLGCAHYKLAYTTSTFGIRNR
jgi:hypothetical protein